MEECSWIYVERCKNSIGIVQNYANEVFLSASIMGKQQKEEDNEREVLERVGYTYV